MDLVSEIIPKVGEVSSLFPGRNGPNIFSQTKGLGNGAFNLLNLCGKINRGIGELVVYYNGKPFFISWLSDNLNMDLFLAAKV